MLNLHYTDVSEITGQFIAWSYLDSVEYGFLVHVVIARVHHTLGFRPLALGGTNSPPENALSTSTSVAVDS